MRSTVTAITSKKDPRVDQARAWLEELGLDLQSDFQDIAGDASFRRYFRVRVDGESRVLMDSPPPGQNVRPFMDIAQRLRTANLHAPEIFHADWQNGFLLLEDLGDSLYRDILGQHNVDTLFPELFSLLRRLAASVSSQGLPEYSAQMLRFDMNIFPDWYLGHHRTGMPRGKFDALWDGFCNRIIDSALSQPQCFVHRDFHSCNLLRTRDDTVGIIDFQDAVTGPISYDLISLIWDRYIGWPRQRIENWIEEFRSISGIEIPSGQWLRYCDLMGLQRNIKIAGIFARLKYRDGKSGYIEMIPRFYGYITDTLSRYPEFSDMLDILEHPECVP